MKVVLTKSGNVSKVSIYFNYFTHHIDTFLFKIPSLKFF